MTAAAVGVARRVAGPALAVAVAVSPPSARGEARAPEAPSWLDSAGAAEWSVAGGAVPRAPAAAGGAPTDERCRAHFRPAFRPADRAVAKAGWSLFGPTQLFGATEIVKDATGVDGMCRPTGYQAFVFVDGEFAGMVAPSPMQPRADGAALVERLASPDALSVDFARYAAADPLCCPSRVSTVTYRDERIARGPVLRVAEVRTDAAGAGR